jgi:hypothetical protein
MRCGLLLLINAPLGRPNGMSGKQLRPHLAGAWPQLHAAQLRQFVCTSAEGLPEKGKTSGDQKTD